MFTKADAVKWMQVRLLINHVGVATFWENPPPPAPEISEEIVHRPPPRTSKKKFQSDEVAEIAGGTGMDKYSRDEGDFTFIPDTNDDE